MLMLAHCPRRCYAAPLDAPALISRLGDVVAEEIRERLRYRLSG
jgi:hypothetical protein